MKILQVVRQYYPSTGGMETYVSSLCRELSRRGISADVATLDYLFKTNERLPAYEQVDGIDVIRLPSAGNPRYFLAPGLLRLLPRYDLVHIHGVDFFMDLLGALRRIHGKPVVLSTHGGFFHTDWGASFKKAYFHTVTRTALKGVDSVIACSPQDEALFRRICSRVVLVENGIDYQRFAAVRSQPDDNTLLFLGRISKNKRIDRLIEAFARLRDSRPAARLLIIGPDWEGLGPGLRQMAEGLGLGDSVEFTGPLPQERVLEEMAQARLFVSASEYEAFGLSTVEAMAAGKVAVVNRIGAFAEIIDDGETGFITDYADTEAASRALESALDLNQKRLREIGKNAQKSAARYDWRRVSEQILHVYEEALSGYGTGPGRFAAEINGSEKHGSSS